MVFKNVFTSIKDNQQKKRVFIMTLIAILTLLSLILGASYAYFSVFNSNNSSTSVLRTTTGSVGTVVLTNPTSNLHINLKALNMQSGNSQTVLYATTTDADYEERSTPRSIGTSTVVGGDTDVNYNCSYDLNITLTGTMVNSLQNDDAKLILSGIYEDVIDLTNLTSPITIVVDTLSGTYREASLYAVLLFHNKTSNQDYLKGKSLEIELENSNLHCEIKTDEGFNLAYKNFSGNEYVPADIKLFDEENYLKDFELGFTIDYINPNRFRNGQVDTVFNSLYEVSPFPGITFRIQNSKWFFQVGNGFTSKKLTFEPNEIQSFKVMRINGVVYYSINGGIPVPVLDVSNLKQTFDTPVTFGVSLDGNNSPMATRYLMAEVSNMYVRFLDSGNTESLYDYIDSEIESFINKNLVTVFNSSSSHLFDGKAATAIDSGVALFSTANYQKDFVATFYIESFDFASQISSQATLFNAKNESATGAPGIVFRRSSSNQFELAVRNSNGTASTVRLPNNINRVNIIRKNMVMYYQVDYGEILPLGTNNDISTFDVNGCFNINTTFGSNINASGNIDRVIVGTLSNMRIKMASN